MKRFNKIRLKPYFGVGRVLDEKAKERIEERKRNYFFFGEKAEN